jgi:N-acetylglutamate synthase-like GNAT family acetyltransferase
LRQVPLADFLIRPAGKEDFPAIRGLIHAVRINPMGLDWRRFLIAVGPGNRFSGCGQIKLHTDGSRELASIAVTDEFRGRGVARALIEALLARETSRPLYLMCRAELKPLYARFGFEEADGDNLPRYFQRIKRIERLFNQSADPTDRLAIMRLD